MCGLTLLTRWSCCEFVNHGHAPKVQSLCVRSRHLALHDRHRGVESSGPDTVYQRGLVGAPLAKRLEAISAAYAPPAPMHAFNPSCRSCRSTYAIALFTTASTPTRSGEAPDLTLRRQPYGRGPVPKPRGSRSGHHERPTNRTCGAPHTGSQLRSLQPCGRNRQHAGAEVFGYVCILAQEGDGLFTGEVRFLPGEVHLEQVRARTTRQKSARGVVRYCDVRCTFTEDLDDEPLAAAEGVTLREKLSTLERDALLQADAGRSVLCV